MSSGGDRIQRVTSENSHHHTKGEGGNVSVLDIPASRCLSLALCQEGHRSVSVPEKCPIRTDRVSVSAIYE